jgi:hypothetical protein
MREELRFWADEARIGGHQKNWIGYWFAPALRAALRQLAEPKAGKGEG